MTQEPYFVKTKLLYITAFIEQFSSAILQDCRTMHNAEIPCWCHTN